MHVPRSAWFFRQPPSDLHGLGHTARVMVWACVLARGGAWLDSVLWAAACHDLRRADDGADPEHGFRAGAWVREQFPGLVRQVPDQLEWIASACDWHVCPDHQAEWDHPILWLLKDADGLDRVRLGDLNARFLRHRHTHHWQKAAQALYDATDLLDDPTAIWRIALEQQLPVAELIAWNEKQRTNLRGAAMFAE